MNTSRYRRSRSIRRDPLPHSLRFIRHRPWLFRFGALRLLRGWPRGHPRSAIQVLFLLSCLPVCCLWCWLARGVGWLGVLVLSVHINALPNALLPLRGSRKRRPQPCVPAPLAEDYNSTLATREDNAEVRPHPTVQCHPPPASAHFRPGLPESPALAYVPERSWLRWHPHEATVAKTARCYSFTP
jgi:hypothetical protein